LPLGAAVTPLVDEGGALLVGVLPDGAGVTGEVVVPPGCCAKPGALKNRNDAAKAMIAEFNL
jgi:hypothetical protein